MDSTGFGDWNELGVESIATDPVDPAQVWVAAGEYTQPWAVPLDGEILRSDDQGRSWQVTDLPIQLASNQDGRNMGERLAVDPNDDRILYLASPANGLWRSTDGGVTWAQVTSFPVTSTPDDIGLSFVTFDPAGGHRGQPTKTIFVGDASGTDLYESTDAGASWQLVPGQPTGMMPQHGVLASDGTLYVDYANQPGPNGMTNGSVWKYGTGTGAWTNITPEVPGADGNPAFGYAGLAVDPEHPGTVMVATNDRWSPVEHHLPLHRRGRDLGRRGRRRNSAYLGFAVPGLGRHAQVRLVDRVDRDRPVQPQPCAVRHRGHRVRLGRRHRRGSRPAHDLVLGGRRGHRGDRGQRPGRAARRPVHAAVRGGRPGRVLPPQPGPLAAGRDDRSPSWAAARASAKRARPRWTWPRSATPAATGPPTAARPGPR